MYVVEGIHTCENTPYPDQYDLKKRGGVLYKLGITLWEGKRKSQRVQQEFAGAWREKKNYHMK